MLQGVTTEICAGTCALQCINEWSGKENKEEKGNLCWGVMKDEIDCEDLEEDSMMLSDGQ